MLSELPPAYSSQGVEAIFQLEHIILAGHAREVPSDIPPRGLQIVLSDLLRNQEVDTIIMANVTGLLPIQICTGNTSIVYPSQEEVWSYISSKRLILQRTGNDESHQLLSLTTFNGLTIYPRVRKRPDKIGENLIQPLSTSPTTSKKGPAAEFSKLMGQVKDIATGMLKNQGIDLANGASRSVIKCVYSCFRLVIREVDRVIFVDSDQGFRFWDTGYWKEVFKADPYHIRYLLVCFDNLSSLMNESDCRYPPFAKALSWPNLGQDLPNNMQGILPIFTLDQSWLWCETWCSDEGLKTAKTIDLCNNPLTHEPKLKRARRLIPEWDAYDQEVAALAARIKKHNQGDLAAKITVQAGQKIEDDQDLSSDPPSESDHLEKEMLDSSGLDQENPSTLLDKEGVSRDEL
ncbi:hypothetical protein PGT21_016877 [Puccinia graminis f. sp. tritici]|uniref:Glucosyltransferase 24 catalytic domain-containing protein n=1 Tax=Puccinia graminis f. sp. tritici TaxID=56615 RepID=A0A5B0N107_PUCGR|nr:hypothetical protein PGT21_016877 [Puccinia graminis f. sp. tritici]